ncbi:MAG: T9SS type A sorting domain-containing protein [Saprospiraceae bacterium]|nr:T9SS type A sorting domain-containing protein [Saprospiraceae bacterium]
MNNEFSKLLLNYDFPLSSVEISYSDSLLVKRCTNPMKFLRTWRIKDKCSNNFRILTTNVNLTGYEDSFIHDVLSTEGVCNNDGAITVTPRGEFGPYSYKWNVGDSVNSIYNRSPGTYQVTITDRFKCNAVRLFFLQNMSDVADVGGRILTKNGYHVYPDSLLFADSRNITNSCVSRPQVLQYSFNLEKELTGVYSYKFRKLSEPLLGISTKDILLIQKHILQIKKFSDTLSVFAADALGNYNVAGSDMSEIRKLILGVIPNFTKMDPWVFLRQDYLTGLNQNTLLRDILFTGANVNALPKQNIDVLALKIGDVDFSYRGPLLQNEEGETRESKPEIPFHYAIEKTEMGVNKYNFYLQDLEQIEGLQLGLKVGVDFDIVNSQIPFEFIHVDSDNNLRISWSTGYDLNVNTELPLFSIKVNSISQEANLSLIEEIESEVYLANNIDLSLRLRRLYSQNSIENEDIKLIPNPAHNQITIQTDFEMNSIVFYNNLGQVCKAKSISNHSFDISSWPDGIYTMHLVSTEGLFYSKKIIKGK